MVGIGWNVGDAEDYTLSVATDHDIFANSAMVRVHNSSYPVVSLGENKLAANYNVVLNISHRLSGAGYP